MAGTYIRATYFPTVYGSIVVKSSDNGSNTRSLYIPSDGTMQVGDLGLKIQTLEQINAQLEAERAALRAENERLRKEQAAQAEAMQKVSPK
ncbi:MAG TPA: bZIP transcription factor [candidate division Zixibacteria bacterium]|nr:bZIP transcription factor [candidate division Zixibacteria bacterium]